MEKESSVLKHLLEISKNEKYEELDSYRTQKKWKKMSQSERHLFAHLLVLQGKEELLNGNTRVLQTFEISLKVFPNDPTILYEQGEALATQKNSFKCLELSSQLLNQAIKHLPEDVESRVLLGKVYLRLGILSQDGEYLQFADSSFQEVELFFQGAPLDFDLLYHWGLCYYELGNISGEALDYFRSVEKFKEAKKKGVEESSFWSDYSLALYSLGKLLFREELLIEAAGYVMNAVKDLSNCSEGWKIRAEIYAFLSKIFYKRSYFEHAQDSYSMLYEMYPDDTSYWCDWCRVLVNKGRWYKDTSSLQNALAKLEHITSVEPKNSVALQIQGEALLLLGAYTDELKLLKEAEEKLLESLFIDTDSVDTWRSYGFCLIELGVYFSDGDYFLEAIEKFDYGLSLNENHPESFQGIVFAYLRLAEIYGDAHFLYSAAEYASYMFKGTGKNNPRFWNDWGIVFSHLAEYRNESRFIEDAVKKYERCITLCREDEEGNPFCAEYYYNYGCALDFLGDFSDDESYYKRAIEALEKSIELDKDFSHARFNLALAFSHLGELTHDVDHFKEAITHYKALIDQDPEDEMTWNEWGIALLNIAQLRSDPSNPEEGKGLYSEAESYLLRAISLGCVTAYYNLSCLYSLTGNVSSALYFLGKAENSHALPFIEDIMHDEWLEPLRKSGEFQVFINQLVIKRKQR